MKKILLGLCLLLLSACAAGGPATKGDVPAKPSRAMIPSGPSKTRPDPTADRQIVLVRAHTPEKFEGVYYKNGTYLPAAMEKIRRVMRDRTTDKVGPVDPELIDFLVDIRTRLGLPPTVVFEILSGYRAPSSNAEIAKDNKSVAKESLHMYGWAIDFRISAVNGSAIAEIAKTMQRGGVSFYPADNHVHVDIGNIRTWGKGPRLPKP